MPGHQRDPDLYKLELLERPQRPGKGKSSSSPVPSFSKNSQSSHNVSVENTTNQTLKRAPDSHSAQHQGEYGTESEASTTLLHQHLLLTCQLLGCIQAPSQTPNATQQLYFVLHNQGSRCDSLCPYNLTAPPPSRSQPFPHRNFPFPLYKHKFYAKED